MIIVVSIMALVMKSWKMTAHVYSYDKGDDIQEKILSLAEGEKENEDDDTENTKEPEESTPPPQSPNPDNDAAVEEENPSVSPSQDPNEEEKEVPDANETEEDSDDGTDKTPGDNGDNGNGDNGDGEGEGDGDGGDDTTDDGNGYGEDPSASPVASEKASEGPKASASPSASPKVSIDPDKVKKLHITWPDKDNIYYGKDIPKETIVVKAEMDSGDVYTLEKGDYSITGLNNMSIGQHYLTVVYGTTLGRLKYTVQNYVKGLYYDWETKDKCYYGEKINDNVLWVYVKMADSTEVDVDYGDYTLSGVDNTDTSGTQNFTISYDGMEVSGTCRFWDKTITYIYQDSSGKVINTVEETFTIDDADNDRSIKKESTYTYKGTSYKVTKAEATADGKSISFPVKLSERRMEIVITYTLEET
ncbi:MAG: bacterial Ig-like domain-containing protein [Lachnospiraceae bacterium]|nr:bacterial Ig-like domain-containing protein [Lachnospiraceae bacterium]